MNEDKQQTPSPEKRELCLTDLVERNKQITASLEAHTNARNFLWKVATGAIPLPVLAIKPLPDSGPHIIENVPLVDMNHLPQEAVETILVMLIEHEEKLAFDAWKDLVNNATAACGVIQKIIKMREEQNSKQQHQNANEFPAVVPKKEEKSESPEVHRSRPGRDGPRISNR